MYPFNLVNVRKCQKGFLEIVRNADTFLSRCHDFIKNTLDTLILQSRNRLDAHARV